LTEDDERLLLALEGLTLDLDHGQREAKSAGEAREEGLKLSEPSGEHGTRSEFIKNVSETLISRVNSEATDIEQAKQLMHQYMLEFCAEYDRCSYGRAPAPKTDTENKQPFSDRTSASTASQNAGADKKQSR